MNVGTGEPQPFSDLPAALVDEVLGRTAEVAEELLDSFQNIKEQKLEFRRHIEESGYLLSDAEFDDQPAPTTCATDGSYAIERLLTTDLVAAAAVAVEGITPPSEKRHWPIPRHETFIAAEPHLEDTATVLRAVMLGEELKLAREAPHEVVMFDGTLTLPVIYFNQALNKAPETCGRLKSASQFINRCTDYLEAYLSLLRSERSDKQYVALPKYSTRREIGTALCWPDHFDDRGILTLLLNAGELTTPMDIEHPRDAHGNLTWHLNTAALPGEVRTRAEELAREVTSAIGFVQVFYYKPRSWLPALRVEASRSITQNKHRLATVLLGLKFQTATPAMLEPYPLYLADRTVKALARALPAFRQVTTQQVSEKYRGEVGEVFFAMHGYRTEAGR